MRNRQILSGLLFLAMSFLYLNIQAQTYVYTTFEGVAYAFEEKADLTTIPGWQPGVHPGRFGKPFLGHPNNNVLSEWQELPFTWSFYGQPVTGYYASDNGYITFDRGASKGIPNNTTIPSAAEPNDAIYAFWADWHLDGDYNPNTNRVLNLTMGVAPNRLHVIMWGGVTPGGVKGGANNNASFFLVLHESGGFDIALMACRKNVPMNGTIGVENYDGSRATMVTGSPNFDFPPLTPAPNDMLYWEFRYTDMQHAARVIQTNLPNISIAGKDVVVGGSLQNEGSQTINSFDVLYQVDQDAPVRSTIRNVSIGSSEIAEFSHSLPWKPTEAGKMHQLKVWIDNVNGNSNPASLRIQPYSKPVFVNLGKTAEKKVLVEQFTGTWCVWCPDGSVHMSNIEKQNKNAVLVAIHAGGNDAMITPEGTEIAGIYTPSYPAAMIDRFQFDPASTHIPMGRGGNAWLNSANSRQNEVTPVKVNIEPVYNSSTRSITATVSADFVDFAYPGDFRIHFMIVEDRVVGEGRGYDQSNAFSNNNSFPNHIYFSETNPIRGYVHRNVLRAVPSGAEGTARVISGAPKAGDSFKKTYTFTLPEGINDKEVSLVAFVAYHDDIRVAERFVLNTQEVKLIE